MKTSAFSFVFLITFVSGLDSANLPAQDALKLQIRSQPDRVQLQWQSKIPLPLSTSIARYQIQRSSDLDNWETVGETVAGRMGISDESLQTLVARGGSQAYYRLVGQVGSGSVKASGGEVFGYGSAFARELARLGQISPGQFAALYPAPVDYLKSLSFDPTTAQYWAAFNADAQFRLNADELKLFKQNGFVVSERLGAYSFADGFYRVFIKDLPVFISADAILQAWHFSYQAMLIELEETHLNTLVDSMLGGMVAPLSSIWTRNRQGVLKDSVMDADYFLAVARSLLSGKPETTVTGQDDRVAKTLAAIKLEQMVDCFDLFGAPRAVDFSQFKVRGHYESSELLRRYFQCLMWLGRTDLRVAGGPYQDAACAGSHDAVPRELGTAIVLYFAMQQSGQMGAWQEFDQIIQTFVGWTDSLTFLQLGDLLAAANIRSTADVTSLDVIQQLRSKLEQGQVGMQQIRSDYYYSPFGAAQVKLPVSFTVAGQKFVPDSWALAKVVFDEILWDGAWPAPMLFNKVNRRIPTALDVAFSIFGNNQVVPDLVERIHATDGRAFRDGLPYQHNLAAVRRVIDSQNPALWNSSIYMHWLACLRELSAPATDAQFPEAMRTRAWAMKDLNAQLASWTQLRHDTLLYAKQSYTTPFLCSYPAGFVEPRPAFWQRVAAMARGAASLVARYPMQGMVSLPGSYGWSQPINLAEVHAKQVGFFNQFATAVDRLQAMASKELLRQPFTAAEIDFLKNMMERMDAYGGIKQYNGWYPALFYRNCMVGNNFAENQGSDKWDPLVADVHTDTAAEGDPGCVLHEAVGNIHMLFLAVDCGTDRMMYAGPVLSHYEFDLPGTTRKTDTEWKDDLRSGAQPALPPWTRSYLVPGKYVPPFLSN